MSIISLCRIGLEGKPSIASIGGPGVVRPSSPGLTAPHRWIEVGQHSICKLNIYVCAEWMAVVNCPFKKDAEGEVTKGQWLKPGQT